MKGQYIIEIATSDFSTTSAAVEGGADRIELCANLAEGGTTPSYGLIRKCRETFGISLYPIIRPRGGDFLYSEEEFEIIRQDINICRDFGCDGIVIGMLDEDGGIDIHRTSKLIAAAYPLGVTYHRAFDRCRDPFEAMEQLIDLGCERILTSGQQPGAPEGVEFIAKLNKEASQRIIIMPGSGVRAENIRMLAEKTGCIEFHSSLRGKHPSSMKFIHPAFATSAESYSNNYIDPSEVRALKSILENKD
ncbi:MAG: copper homeostasis protein CutC [Chitinophagaceae bacterium]|nr:copper homeostasis protein CutC [Chitinophagaceae bacterium]